jgi:cytochrome c peroxidase
MTALNSKEKEGLRMFMDIGCTTCHVGATLGGTMLQKFPLIGTDYKTLTGSIIDDKGKFKFNNIEADKYLFKVPSLFNITEMYPYFHDGSIKDLSSAIKIMAKLQLNKDLTDNQVQSIMDFLGALKAEIPAILIQETKLP